jgi:hypothetical protein
MIARSLLIAEYDSRVVLSARSGATARGPGPLATPRQLPGQRRDLPGHYRIRLEASVVRASSGQPGVRPISCDP